jgi:electron transfer flavoprotein beta subunit
MSSRIVVCIKSVMVEAPAGRVVRTAESSELNPFDRPALAAARFLKNALTAEVTALSMGPPSAAAALYEAIALGADRGVLLSDPALAGSDTLATSTALAAAVERLGVPDWLIFGTRTADSDTGQVGPQTAVKLGMPLATGVTEIGIRAEGASVVREMDGFIETYAAAPPAALTIHPRAFADGQPGLADLAGAFESGRVDIWPLERLGLKADQVGEAGSPTRVVALARRDQGRHCVFLSGTLEEMADELVRRLVQTARLGF